MGASCVLLLALSLVFVIFAVVIRESSHHLCVHLSVLSVILKRVCFVFETLLDFHIVPIQTESQTKLLRSSAEMKESIDDANLQLREKDNSLQM